MNTSRHPRRRALQRAQRLTTAAELASALAHELNNLLSIMMANLQFALEELGDHPAADDLRQVETAASRAAGISRQLLVFSGRESSSPQELDVNAVVSDMGRLLAPALGQGIQLEILLSPDTPPVEADLAHLEQVLVNLVLNARDAMGDGGQLKVRTRATRVGSRRHAEIAVTDSGAGMTEEVRRRAFEAFFTTKPEGTGTGLGLATSRRMVRDMGGDVQLTSAPGVGTIAVIHLPGLR